MLNPNHIDRVIKFHKKNLNFDIILPGLVMKNPENTNIVKVITDIKNKVMFLSRLKLPLELKAEYKRHLKHLSIISFKPDALKKFYKSKKTPLETAEDIELLRALEIGLTIKSVVLEGDSFSVDVEEDYKKAKANINLNKFFKLYK